MRISNSSILIAMLVLILAAISCSGPAYHEEKEIPGEAWRIEDTLKYSFQVPDTVKAYNVILEISHTETYEYRNLWLFITTRFPSGKVYVDTFNCYLAAPDGQWAGGGGDEMTADVVYRLKVRFPERGTYQMDICHAMRSPSLQGIKAIALRVEEYEMEADEQ